jgi:hypothetical protein
MRVPHAADAAVIKSFGAGIVQFIAPASNAIPGDFWKRKILSGRLAEPGRPGEVNVSFTLAQRLHLRPGASGKPNGSQRHPLGQFIIAAFPDPPAVGHRN